MNLIIAWYLKLLFSFRVATTETDRQVASNYLKVTMSLSQNSKQQEALIKATIETDCQDHPDSDTGNMPGIGT